MLYADPGSGVLIWQILLALFFGVTFYFTKLRHWIIARVRPEPNDLPLKTAAEAYPSKSISEGE